MFGGRCPWIWFSLKLNVINEERLKNEGGIVPDNLFTATSKNVSLDSWPKEVGIIPPKLLKRVLNTSREDKFPKEGEILPIRLFL